MPKKPATTPDLVHAILAEVEKDCKHAEADLRDAMAERTTLVQRIEAEGKPSVEALQDAKADVALVARLQGRLPSQQYDIRHRAAQKALDIAQATFDANREDALKRIAPLNHRITAVQKRLHDLEAQRQAHARFAKTFQE